MCQHVCVCGAVVLLPADQVTEQLKALEKSSGTTGAALKALMEKAVTDSAFVEEHGKRLPGFTYLSAAEANKIVAERRKQVRSMRCASGLDFAGLLQLRLCT